jgi:hypothetical protein
MIWYSTPAFGRKIHTTHGISVVAVGMHIGAVVGTISTQKNARQIN